MTKPSLVELEQQFQAYLLQQENAISGAIASPAQNDSIAARLNIYGQAYYLRLTDAIKMDYPGLTAALRAHGLDPETVLRAYLKAYPSHSFSVRYIATHLVDFIGSEYPDTPWRHLTQFEQALCDVLDDENTAILQQNDLQKIPMADWPALQFHLIPALRIVTTQYNFLPFWQAVQGDNAEILPEITRLDYEVTYLIWRRSQQAMYRALTEDEVWLINAIQSGAPFERTCEGLCRWFPEELAAQTMVTRLKQWLAEEILAKKV